MFKRITFAIFAVFAVSLAITVLLVNRTPPPPKELGSIQLGRCFTSDNGNVVCEDHVVIDPPDVESMEIYYKHAEPIMFILCIVSLLATLNGIAAELMYLMIRSMWRQYRAHAD